MITLIYKTTKPIVNLYGVTEYQLELDNVNMSVYVQLLKKGTCTVSAKYRFKTIGELSWFVKYVARSSSLKIPQICTAIIYTNKLSWAEIVEILSAIP